MPYTYQGKPIKTAIGTIHYPKLFVKWVMFLTASVFLWKQLKKVLIR
jgi:hypothetical protein